MRCHNIRFWYRNYYWIDYLQQGFTCAHPKSRVHTRIPFRVHRQRLELLAYLWVWQVDESRGPQQIKVLPRCGWRIPFAFSDMACGYITSCMPTISGCRAARVSITLAILSFPFTSTQRCTLKVTARTILLPASEDLLLSSMFFQTGCLLLKGLFSLSHNILNSNTLWDPCPSQQSPARTSSGRCSGGKGSPMCPFRSNRILEGQWLSCSSVWGCIASWGLLQSVQRQPRWMPSESEHVSECECGWVVVPSLLRSWDNGLAHRQTLVYTQSGLKLNCSKR